MNINIGSDKIKDVYVGEDEVSRIYVGEDLVWQKTETKFDLLWTNSDITSTLEEQSLDIDYSNYDSLMFVLTGMKMDSYSFDDDGWGFMFISTTNADGDTYHPYMASGSMFFNSTRQIKQSYREITLNKDKNKITFGKGQVMVCTDSCTWTSSVPASSEEDWAQFWISDNNPSCCRPYKIYGIKGNLITDSFDKVKCIWNRIDDDPNYPERPTPYDFDLKESKKYNYYLPIVSSNLDWEGTPYSSYSDLIDPSSWYWYERYNEDDPENPIIVKYLTKDDIHYWHCMCGHVMTPDTLYESINGGWYRWEFSQRKPPQTKFNAYRLIGGDPTDSTKAARIVLDNGTYHLKYNNASWYAWLQDGSSYDDSHGAWYYQNQTECILEYMLAFDEPLW